MNEKQIDNIHYDNEIKLIDCTGKELSNEDIKQLLKLKEEEKKKNLEFYEEHKDDEKYKAFFGRR